MNYTVEPHENGAMLRNFLRAHGFSTRTVTRLKAADNGILLNGSRVTVRQILRAGDCVELNLPDDSKPAVAEDITLSVVYEDDDVIVMDKPAYMPVHPSKRLQSGTLANAFAAHMAARGVSAAFRPINRLDRGTSGLVVAGLHAHAASLLAGKIDKIYICICHGKLPGNGTFDDPIRLCRDSKIKRETGDGGQSAVTHFKRIATDGEYSAAAVIIDTGRTHQIRVHFSAHGFPLVGDTLYGNGDDFIGRQALHCAKASFAHPISKKILHFYADLPEDMAYFAKKHKNFEKILNYR